MNWLDIVLILIIVSSVFSGLRTGMARVVVGMGATLVAIILAVWFYGSMASVFQEYVSSRSVANILGFIAIFAAVMLLGALVATLLAKLFKWVGLGWLDRLLGGAVGAVRGVIVSLVVLMMLMAFTPKPPPQAVVNSRLAPYVIDASSVLVAIAPRELKDGFWDSYARVKKGWTDTFRKSAQKPPTREL